MDQTYIKKLYETKDFADCSFVFPNEEGKEIKAHVLVLINASQIFRSMFLKSKEQSNEGYIKIEIKDIELSVFEDLIK